MNAWKRPVLLAVLGLLICAASWWYRSHVLMPDRLSPERAARVRALQERISALNAAIAASPRNVKARWDLATLYQQVGMLTEAADQMQEIVRIAPENERARLSLANLYLASGRVQQAEAEYGAVTRRWPKDADAWDGVASAFYRMGRFLECRQAAQKAVNLEPRDPNHHFILGAGLLEYAMEFPNPQMHSDALLKAQAEFTLILGAWPDQGDVYFRLGRTCMGLRNGKDALRYLRRAMELLPELKDALIWAGWY